MRLKEPVLRRTYASRSLWIVGATLCVGVLSMPVWSRDTSGPTPASTSRPSDAHSPGPPEADAVAALLDQLGDPAYKIRKKAADRLKGLPRKDITDALAERYKTTRDFEVKLLIREIAQTIYMKEREEGFLGVALDPRPVTSKEIPRIPEGQAGIRVNFVLKDTAAHGAGITNGDIILGCNGKPIPPGTPEDASKGFRELIASFRPHTPMSLELLGGNRKRVVNLRLGARPEQQWTREKAIELEAIEKSMRAWWREHFETDPARRAGNLPGDQEHNSTDP